MIRGHRVFAEEHQPKAAVLADRVVGTGIKALGKVSTRAYSYVATSVPHEIDYFFSAN